MEGTSLGSAPGPEPETGPAVDLSSLPLEVWLQILIHVPPRTLVTRCRAVCHQWRALVDGPILWRLLWAQAKDAPSQALLVATHCYPPAPKPCSWARLGILQPLARNLLRNTCGEEGFRKWKVKDGGHGWKVEQNLRPVPGAPAQTCFASSFRGCGRSCWTTPAQRSTSVIGGAPEATAAASTGSTSDWWRPTDAPSWPGLMPSPSLSPAPMTTPTCRSPTSSPTSQTVSVTSSLNTLAKTPSSGPGTMAPASLTPASRSTLGAPDGPGPRGKLTPPLPPGASLPPISSPLLPRETLVLLRTLGK
ncbi:F-box only protein 27 isoform 2-T2 [Sarcophilus harrisii]